MAGNKYAWSTTAATNASADSTINWAEGQLPGTVNDSARAMMAVEAAFLADTNATAGTGGTGAAYTVTSNLTPAALASGLKLRLRMNVVNTGACTLTVTPNGAAAFAAKAIRVYASGSVGDVDPAAAQLKASGIYDFNYDAAANGGNGAWICLNPTPPAAASLPTRQVFTTGSGTYTLPANAKWIEVELVGGGGGGGGGGGAGATAGGGGGNTTFGSSFLTGNGGGGGGVGSGTPNTATPTASGGDINISGAIGGYNGNFADSVVNAAGGTGGGTPFGGGAGGIYNATGVTAAPNSGAGGGGGGTNTTTAAGGGQGGNSGGYVRKLITSPSATYSYAVGAAGAAGSAGGAGLAGGVGGAGIIVVTEFYV